MTQQNKQDKRKRKRRRLRDIKVKELSLVDTPAVQDAKWLIAKRGEADGQPVSDSDVSQTMMLAEAAKLLKQRQAEKQTRKKRERNQQMLERIQSVGESISTLDRRLSKLDRRIKMQLS